MSRKRIPIKNIMLKMTAMFAVMWLTGQFFMVNCYANLANNKVVTGTKKLLNDAIPVLQAIGGVICAVIAIYFFIRKANADEQDQKMWKNRIAITIISAIGIVVIGGVITTIVSYYE